MDRAMCLNHRCPRRESCLRYRAVPSEYQYYSDFPLPCEDHIPIPPQAPVRTVEEVEGEDIRAPGLT